MKLLSFFITIGNSFLKTFVAFKIYTWYSPEVGLELPGLTYLNLFSIIILYNILKANPSGTLLKLNTYEEITGKKFGSIKDSLTDSIVYLIFLLFSWIFYLILF